MTSKDPDQNNPSKELESLRKQIVEFQAKDLAHKRTMASIASQKAILEMIAMGGSLPVILNRFCEMIEEQSNGMLCSILILEGTNLRYGAGPSLPEAYNRIIDGLEIGPQAGSCGTAAYRKESVVVSDIATDPLWERGRHLALGHGLRACWSVPILSSPGNLLGTFAMYYREPRSPSIEEQSLIEIYAHLASIAIERKRAEESLKKSEERFRRLVETANVLPWEVDFHTWRMTYVGPQARTLLGYPIEDWYQDRFWQDHLHPEDREWTDRYCHEAAIQQRNFELEYRMLTADGAIVWVRDIVNVVLDDQGKPISLHGFMFDITQRKQAEISLLEGEERLQAILDNSPAVVVVKDSEGRYLLVNHQWERLFCLTRKQIIGKTLHDIFPKQTADILFANDKKVLDAMAPIEFEETIPQEDGDHTYLSIKFPMSWASGKPPVICGIATDITGRKQAEENVRESELRYRTLVEHAPLCIHELDLNGKFLCVNSAGVQMMNVDEEQQLIGVQYLDDIALEDRNRVGALLSKACQGESSEFEFKSAGKGKARVIASNFIPIKNPDGITIKIMGISQDITERKRAEEALRESEKQYRIITDNIHDMIWEANSEGKYTYVSPSHKDVAGYEPSELMNANIFATVHPEDLPRVLAEFERVFRTESSGQAVYRNKHRNGEWRWMETAGKTIRTSEGKVRAVGATRDITERKRAEEALHKSEERYRALYEDNPSMYFTVASNGTILSVNNFGAQQLGYEVCELVGQSVLTVFHEDDTASIQQNLKECFQNPLQMADWEFRKVRKDGSMLWVKEIARIVQDTSGEAVILIVCEDISERKFATDLLATQNHVLELIASGVSLQTVLERLCQYVEQHRPGAFSSVLLLDQDGKTLRLGAAPTLPKEFANGMDGLTIGYQGGSCGAAAFLGEQVIVPDVTTDPLFTPFVDVPLKNGIRACWSTPFFSEKGKVIGTVAICHSVPCAPTSQDQHLMKTAAGLASIACERQRTEKVLKESETRLRQAQKMEAIGRLAGGIAHDFNNILSAILGYTELTMTLVAEESRTRHYLQEVLTAGHRAKDLTKQILVFSRQTEQERKPTSLKLIIKEVLQLIRATLPSTIEIRHNLEIESDTVLADPVQMHQVLMNLCANACQAMGETGGALEVHLESLEITSKHTPPQASETELMPGSYLTLIVQDTGPGMTSEVLDRIFEPFFTTKGVGEGAGMGLSVVHGIITNHGGSISVNSVPGHGTTFTIYLPRIDVPSPRELRVEKLVPGGGRERVLFVEDEEPLAHLGQKMLEHLGYAVSIQTNSVEALKTFRAAPQRFDLVITDQTMPSMTGEVLARELLLIRPELPIILCTGYSPSMTPEKAQALGIRAYLWKPIVSRDLGLTIQQVLTQESRDR